MAVTFATPVIATARYAAATATAANVAVASGDIVLVLAGWENGAGAARAVSGVTFNGSATGWAQAGTTLTSSVWPSRRMAAWVGTGLSGTHDLVVTWDAANENDGGVVYVYVISGAHATAPVDADEIQTYTGNGSDGYATTPTSAVTVPANGYIFDLCAQGVDRTATAAGTNHVADSATQTLDAQNFYNGSAPASGGGTVQWTSATAEYAWLHMAVPVSPATASAAAPSSLATLGVG